MLTDPDTCTSPSAVVDVTQFAPGGLVAVTVSCSVSARGIDADRARRSAVGPASVHGHRVRHDRSLPGDRGDAVSRGRGDRGSSMVTGVVLLFAFTAGAIIWLARDVDRAVSDRASAQSIAFQAARSGAQQVDIESLRRLPSGPIAIDPALAQPAVESTAARLLDAYGLDGAITVDRRRRRPGHRLARDPHRGSNRDRHRVGESTGDAMTARRRLPVRDLDRPQVREEVDRMHPAGSRSTTRLLTSLVALAVVAAAPAVPDVGGTAPLRGRVAVDRGRSAVAVGCDRDP